MGNRLCRWRGQNNHAQNNRLCRWRGQNNLGMFKMDVLNIIIPLKSQSLVAVIRIYDIYKFMSVAILAQARLHPTPFGLVHPCYFFPPSLPFYGVLPWGRGTEVMIRLDTALQPVVTGGCLVVVGSGFLCKCRGVCDPTAGASRLHGLQYPISSARLTLF